MYLEIPKLERCCCCVPLRRGIVILGYLSLGFALLFITLDVYFSEGRDLSSHSYILFRGASFIAQRWLFYVMYSVEIVFIAALLVGAHTRNSRLMLIYYYYGITTTLASLATLLYYHLRYTDYHYSMYLIDFAIIFCAIVTQAYLLLLIRSELEKPRQPHRFVNHLAEVCAEPARGNGLNPL